MDFSMIRPKPPAMKPPPPLPKEKPPSSNPPPAAPKEPPPPPPPPHQEMTYPRGYGPPRMGPYMEELDRSSRVHGLRSVEYTNARTWRANFGGYNDDYYDNPYKYGPSGHQPSRYMLAPPHSHDYMSPLPSPRLGVPPPDHYHGLPGPPLRVLPPSDHHHSLPGPPRRLGLPPPYHHHALPGPPPRLGLPPPDYHHHHGPPPPSPYYHSQPYYGYFSDENPNGCTVM
ncbi:unnamed protein product [Fraxinus pennsylvanica]|uniref:Uncharacterized protein n=1 Tax=Fraxinus pennsylvanica TaxID=56036 RepID=A0AAD1ZVX9_9LAMI|nr:unnamed protein product [Fraxinus pennsylvanica]